MPAASERTAAILLGASDFEKAGLSGSNSFYHSARDFRRYLHDENGLRLAPDDVLDLFDDARPASVLLDLIADFLRRYQQSDGTPLVALLLYYVGHGGFTANGQEYFLAVRSTRKDLKGPSSIRVRDLGEILRDFARLQRRYVILDCCFSAEAFRTLQTGPAELAVVKTMSSMPTRGTALLCSSGPKDASLAPADLKYTMFSDALLSALKHGEQRLGSALSLRDIKNLVERYLTRKYQNDLVRPEVHSPDQPEGDISELPLFPNPSYPKGELSANLSRKKLTGGVNKQERAGHSVSIRQIKSFLTLDNVLDLVRMSGLLGPGERVRHALLIYATNTQKTWIITSTRSMFCVLDDAETHESGKYIQWRQAITAAFQVKARPYKKSVGLLDLGLRHDWRYSIKLHPDRDELEDTVKKIVSGPRKTKSRRAQPSAWSRRVTNISAPSISTEAFASKGKSTLARDFPAEITGGARKRAETAIYRIGLKSDGRWVQLQLNQFARKLGITEPRHLIRTFIRLHDENLLCLGKWSALGSFSSYPSQLTDAELFSDGTFCILLTDLGCKRAEKLPRKQ